MIIYEVNLETHSSNYPELMNWLPSHIQEILQMKGFFNAKIMEEIVDVKPADTQKVTISYEIDSMEDLKNYLDSHASEMRAKTQQKFGDKIKAIRRIFKVAFTQKE